MDIEQPNENGRGDWWSKAAAALHVVSCTPRILGLIWRTHRGFAVAALALDFLLALIPLANIELTKIMLDALSTGIGPRVLRASWILTLVLIFAGLNLLANCLRPAADFVTKNLDDLLTRDINSLIMHKVASFADIAIFENNEFQEKLYKIENTSNKVFQTIWNLRSFGSGMVRLLSMLFVLLAFQPLIALAIAVLSLPQVIFQFIHHKKEWSDDEMAEMRKMYYYQSSVTSEYNAKEMRIFGLSNFFIDRYLSMFASYLERRRNLLRRHWRNNLLLSFLSVIGTAGSFAYVAVRAIFGSLSIGSLALYIGAIEQFASELSGAVWSAISVYENNVHMKEFFEFLELPQTMEVLPEQFAQPVPPVLEKGIEFRNVSFAYPGSDKPVLDDISFTIPAGQTIAFVGENGAGKTTIVKLLSRLYDPTSGKIIIEGVDLKEYNLEEWRSGIGVIFQDYCHYTLRARDNIGFGQISAFDDLNAIETAAKRGGAALMIEELPKGYDTILGRSYNAKEEQGSELSGGQWQKIALARAFMRSLRANGTDLDAPQVNLPKIYKDAQLLILDEPTAALDAKSEYEVYASFSELTKGKTTVLISHRFSTVRMADRIMLIENGKVTEQGSHDQLMALAGEYAKLYNLQADRYK